MLSWARDSSLHMKALEKKTMANQRKKHNVEKHTQ